MIFAVWAGDKACTPCPFEELTLLRQGIYSSKLLTKSILVVESTSTGLELEKGRIYRYRKDIEF